jgi:signal transduction histidine kinase
MARADAGERPPGLRALRASGVPWHVAIYRVVESRPLLIDTFCIAVPLVLLDLYYTWINTTTVDMPPRTDLEGFLPRALLVLLTVLPLALRRIRPGVCAGIIAFGALCQVITLTGPGLSIVSVPMAVYATSKFGSRRVSRSYLAVALFGAVLLGGFFAVTQARWEIEMGTGTSLWGELFAPERLLSWFFIMAFAAAVVLVCWLFGDLAGRRQREQDAISERNQLLEKERDQEARLAADAERMRIAREMHDVVSHSMSVMIAQADGGRYVVQQDAERASQAFETIGETGRQALTEMRRMLGVLREERELAVRPAPGLHELPQLLDDVRAAGVDVRAEVGSAEPSAAQPSAAGPGIAESGTRADSTQGLKEKLGRFPQLPEGMGLAVYRIIQEALTNTIKHGGGNASSLVRLWVESEPSQRLMLDVSDTGVGTRAVTEGAGSGLLGMQERAALYGGSVSAQPHAGGFTVTAEFPL